MQEKPSEGFYFEPQAESFWEFTKWSNQEYSEQHWAAVTDCVRHVNLHGSLSQYLHNVLREECKCLTNVHTEESLPGNLQCWPFLGSLPASPQISTWAQWPEPLPEGHRGWSWRLICQEQRCLDQPQGGPKYQILDLAFRCSVEAQTRVLGLPSSGGQTPPAS